MGEIIASIKKNAVVTAYVAIPHPSFANQDYLVQSTPSRALDRDYQSPTRRLKTKITAQNTIVSNLLVKAYQSRDRIRFEVA